MPGINSYYHGSGSASFAGVFENGSIILKPSGKLLKEGKVPFCGELRAGLHQGEKNQLPGINTAAISAVTRDRLNLAIQHALRWGCKRWNPQIAELNIERIKKALDVKKQELEQATTAFSPEYVLQFLERECDVLTTLISIEELRLTSWEQIDKTFRTYIEDPYPVIYGIDYDKEVLKVKFNVTEIGIPENVQPILYVPEEKIEGLLQDASRWGIQDAQILSFDNLKDSDLDSLQIKRAFDDLMAWKNRVLP